MGFETSLRHNALMMCFRLCLLGLIGLFSLPAMAEPTGGKASAWLDFREARLRLVMAPSTPDKTGLVGAVEIQLAPGYKTYWRSVGDSGVPPQADFSASQSLSALKLEFPFPKAFDDGAGGKAWGYVEHVMLPISGKRGPGKPVLAVKLDFAVCGTMCIPLHGEIRLDPESGRALDAAEAKQWQHFIGRVPVVDSQPVKVLAREGSAEAPVWVVSLAHPGNAADITAFAEADGFLETRSVEPHEPGRIRVTLVGQPAPGKGGKFGPVRLTFGTAELPRETMLNLDEARPTP